MTLSHIDKQGKANMVDISTKQPGIRIARASALVTMNQVALQAVMNNTLTKGDVIAVARIAGIQASKQTANLIPLCHPLAVQSIHIDIHPDEQISGVKITAEVGIEGKTGVEMEALTAVSVAALTIYDMCKSVDKAMVIQQVQLETKTGGKSGDWHRSNDNTSHQ